jgi:hypothetical protein
VKNGGCAAFAISGGIDKEAHRRRLTNTVPTAGLDFDLPDREAPPCGEFGIQSLVIRAPGRRCSPIFVLVIDEQGSQGHYLNVVLDSRSGGQP